jgi:hypothetical protein
MECMMHRISGFQFAIAALGLSLQYKRPLAAFFERAGLLATVLVAHKCWTWDY